MIVEPVRLYQSNKGIWHVELKRGAELRWHSLKTRNERTAQRKWNELVRSCTPNGVGQLPGSAGPMEQGKS
jgi:hypothetical protein